MSQLAPEAGPLVRCIDAAHTFGVGPTAVVAVHGASCQVVPKDRIALAGPSGSGKSTLLHMLAGLEQPTAGSVEWPGLNPGRVGEVGVIFQGPSLIPALDVSENIALPLVLEGLDAPEVAARVEHAIDQLSLGSMAHQLPEELSGGQSQRVAIARVLAQRPRLILADEPTGQLDHDTGQHVIDTLLQALDLLGAALVITTHDLTVIRRLDKIWFMHDGRLALEGKL
jgi:putative ABC transport system ATP-binding protein